MTLELIRRAIVSHMTDFPFMADRTVVEIHDLYGEIGKKLVAFTDCPREHLKTVTDIATFRTPKTWFQHLKATHFPVWLLYQFPVQWHEEVQEITVDVGAVYPQFPNVFPRNPGPVHFSYYKSSPISAYPEIGNEGEYED